MLAAVGPEMQKYLWWKKYLTTIQMIQFIAIIVHALQLLIRNPCNYPILFSYLVLPMAIMFLLLFASFYNKTYTGKKPQKRKTSILEQEFKNYPESFRSTS
jgi:elongation of very long chain fatty acids protein 7